MIAVLMKALKHFERAIIVVLIATLAIVLVLAVIDLGVMLYRDVAAPLGFLERHELLEVFGAFLLIVVGLELLETLKAYLMEHVVHVEVVLTAAILAVARKAILLDTKELSGLSLLGIAAVLIALALAFRYVKASMSESRGEGR